MIATERVLRAVSDVEGFSTSKQRPRRRWDVDLGALYNYVRAPREENLSDTEMRAILAGHMSKSTR